MRILYIGSSETLRACDVSKAFVEVYGDIVYFCFCDSSKSGNTHKMQVNNVTEAEGFVSALYRDGSLDLTGRKVIDYF